MPDKLTEVAKQLGQTKRNSEAALRRYNPQHPKIERVRDVFDSTIPFEMEFTTDSQDSIMLIDLYFNKPPPMRGCREGRFGMCCDQLELTVGENLVRITAQYIEGSLTVFNGTTQLQVGRDYLEYDPRQGLVYFTNADGGTYSFCYLRDTYVPFCVTLIDDYIFSETRDASLLNIVGQYNETFVFYTNTVTPYEDGEDIVNHTPEQIAFPVHKRHIVKFTLDSLNFPTWPGPVIGEPPLRLGQRVVITLHSANDVAPETTVVWQMDIEQEIARSGSNATGSKFEYNGAFDFFDPENTGDGRFYIDAGFAPDEDATCTFDPVLCYGNPARTGFISAEIDADLERGTAKIFSNLGEAQIAFSDDAPTVFSDIYITVEYQAWAQVLGGDTAIYGNPWSFAYEIQNLTFCEILPDVF